MSACIIFKGYRGSNGKGYGELTCRGVKWLAHRFAYHTHKGEIPAGKMVCHSCDNKGCINPDHLHIGDASSNLKEAWERGLAGNQNTRKDSCPKCGGNFTYSAAVGGRYCRSCKTEWQKNRRNAARCEGGNEKKP